MDGRTDGNLPAMAHTAAGRSRAEFQPGSQTINLVIASRESILMKPNFPGGSGPQGPDPAPHPSPRTTASFRSCSSRCGGRPGGSPFPHRASSIWLLQPRILPRPSRHELVAMAALRRELGGKRSSVDKNLRVFAAELLQQHLASRSHQAGGAFLVLTGQLAATQQQSLPLITADREA